tara:strand:- start:293 stop:1030 length:738 start_codon:yes stop_codon:yes gene_type:complete
MKKIVLAANWKMYLNESESISFIEKVNSDKVLFENQDIVIFPSHTCIRSVKDHLNLNLKIGMQDCDLNLKGAFTGASSVHSIDVDTCIIGHSERRNIYHESNDNISKKLNIVLNSDVEPIFCIGETVDEKNSSISEKVLLDQLSILPNELQGKNLIIAYEPVWAIGSGEVPSNDYIHKMLSCTKNRLKSLYSDADMQNIKLFYGGSVSADNINELLEVDLIDGFLIGSASADFEKFKNIVKQLKL